MCSTISTFQIGFIFFKMILMSRKMLVSAETIRKEIMLVTIVTQTICFSNQSVLIHKFGEK